MGGLLKKLFGFGNPLQKVVQTAPTSASSQGEKQEGFFSLEQQQLLVAQLQKAIMATGLPLPPEGTAFTIYSVKICIIRWQTGMKVIG